MGCSVMNLPEKKHYIIPRAVIQNGDSRQLGWIWHFTAYNPDTAVERDAIKYYRWDFHITTLPKDGGAFTKYALISTLQIIYDNSYLNDHQNYTSWGSRWHVLAKIPELLSKHILFPLPVITVELESDTGYFDNES